MGILQSVILNNAILILTRRSLAERMEIASLNTLIGMGTVFIVLILITLLISLFKYINLIPNYFQSKKKKKSNIKTETDLPVDNFFTQLVQKEEEELQDLELVAVITAAITASLEGTENQGQGFVVRSIRKVNSKRRISL